MNSNNGKLSLSTISTILMVFLTVAIFPTVYLIQNRQILTPQAASRDSQSILNPTSIPNSTAQRPCGVYGDMNKDGIISKADADSIHELLTNGTSNDSYQAKIGDVDGDGKLSSNDEQQILLYIRSQQSQFPVCSTTRPSPCPSIGDVDADGLVTAIDETEVVASITNPDLLNFYQKIRADVNHDGKVDNFDATLILKYLSGQINTFPACL